MASWASIIKAEKPIESSIPDDCIKINSLNVKKYSKGKWHKVDASSLNFQLAPRPVIIIQKKQTESSTPVHTKQSNIKRVVFVDEDGFVSVSRK